ncbi:MAG: SusC/RagA family TonB-linked outer membrane protein [Bacteroidota bacterium]
MTNRSEKRLNITSWIQATYERSFQQHNFKFLVGANQETFDQSFFAASRTQLPTNDLPSLNTGNPETSTNEGGGTEWALRSFFGRINYDYDGKYLFEANFRRDGTSRFIGDKIWSNFPSVSVGWIVSREPFMANSSFFDFLKIRASYGLLGNQNIGTDFPADALIAFDPSYSFGGAIQGGAAQVTLGNPEVQWETTTQTDIGVNMGILDGRMSIEFDYFIRNTEDILFDQPNPGVTGVREPTTRNIAEVRNTGWESAIRWSDNIGDFTYSIGVNVTNVESEVIQLDPASSAEGDRVVDGNFVLQRGSPINALYGLGVVGVFQSQAEIEGAPDQSAFGIPSPGDLRYEDFNRDGVIDINDRKVLGQDNPTWIYGINLDLGYKGFDFSALIQGIGDAQTYGEGELFVPFNNNAGLSTYWLDAWSPTNPSNTIPRLAFNGGINNNVTNEFWVQDRSYLRLRNVQIGYMFNKSLFENNFIESLRIYLNGQNLLTSTDYLGFDPERAERDGDGGSGYPQLRIITGGINVRF